MSRSNLSNIKKIFDYDLSDNLSTCEINDCSTGLRGIMQLTSKDMRKDVMKSATKPIVWKSVHHQN